MHCMKLFYNITVFHIIREREAEREKERGSNKVPLYTTLKYSHTDTNTDNRFVCVQYTKYKIYIYIRYEQRRRTGKEEQSGRVGM